MTTIRCNIDVDVPSAKVWDVIRDVGAVHTRLAPHFVVDTRLDTGTRTVTFANGAVVRERIISIDEDLRRLAYSASSERIEYHHASFEVIPLSGTRTRLVWTADVMPLAAAEHVRAMMEQGSLAIADTLAKLG
ncbi:MAG TPA: SRPBCC family protein [Steroidobacteraceae bacterium]|nr:SRPBCC family protein [Steroidobacteraceae bacterium]